jgi:hypothetical protein
MSVCSTFGSCSEPSRVQLWDGSNVAASGLGVTPPREEATEEGEEVLGQPQQADEPTTCAECDFFQEAFGTGVYARTEPGLNLVADADGNW